MHVFTSVCGAYVQSQLLGFLLSFNSAVCPVRVHVMTDRANLGEVNKTVHKSREMFKASKLFENVDVTIHKTSYQNSKAAWRTCAHLRLAIPNIHKEAGIYVDVDTRVRGNICHANAVLKSLNASVWAALTTEDGGWYKDGNTEGPFYGETGLNSGVFFFSHFPTSFREFSDSYKGHAPLGDQDIINAYFHEHPKELEILDC